jgi:hypothetical protein
MKASLVGTKWEKKEIKLKWLGIVGLGKEFKLYEKPYRLCLRDTKLILKAIGECGHVTDCGYICQYAVLLYTSIVSRAS